MTRPRSSDPCMPRSALCDRLPRRSFLLKAGVLGSSLTLGQYLRATEDKNDPGRSAILVFLKGGPSHQDTFDLKPDAPAEYRGEFRPTKTKIPGIEICEHLPRLAACADKYVIVRGVSHNLADHGIGSTYLLTGNRPLPTLKYPSYGSVANRELQAPTDLPGYVAVHEDSEGPGFLGTRYGPLVTGERPGPNQEFRVRGLSLSEGVTLNRLDRRRRLSEDLDTAFRGYESLDDPIDSADQFSRRAHEIISSPRARAAFDIDQEPASTRERFGANETGLSLLLAYRLIRAGVRFVTVVVDDWDTHQDNFRTLKNRLLPRFDRGLAALLQTLDQQGILPTTAVMVTGEFGRTPKVNGTAGRDHWARAMFTLFAGGSANPGQVIGATDTTATEPKGPVYTPDDIAATFYRNIGIDPHTEYQTNTGRPVMLVRDGKPIRQLFR